MHDVPPQPSTAQPPRWKPLPALARRVAGVLVEKAKTTPDAYPMSLNALISGCNQKSNRFPLMNVDEDEVERAIDQLRTAGAVAIVQGGGRVQRFRHYMYEWLGVDKLELAVMTELLLRGAQTEGELRGRAARMEPIADVNALRPVLQSLKAKGLIVSLTPEGRGHVLTHALYETRELEKLRSQFAAGSYVPAGDDDESARQSAENVPSPPQAVRDSQRGAVDVSAMELTEIKTELMALRDELSQLAADFRSCREDLDQLKSQLGGL